MRSRVTLFDAALVFGAAGVMVAAIAGWRYGPEWASSLAQEYPRRWITVEVIVEDGAAGEFVVVGDGLVDWPNPPGHCVIAGAPVERRYRDLFPETRRAEPPERVWLVPVRVYAQFPSGDERPLFASHQIQKGNMFRFQGRRSGFYSTIYRWSEIPVPPEPP